MKKFFASLSLGLMLASCVPSTPQARIQQNPRQFARLSAKNQVLIQQGQITRGMSPDAVYLAWGAPSATFQGSKDGKLTERWDYAGARPIAATRFYGAYGFNDGPYGHYGHFRPYGGYGPYGRYSYSGVGFGIGPEITYVPYRAASVWFVNERVDSWERVR